MVYYKYKFKGTLFRIIEMKLINSTNSNQKLVLINIVYFFKHKNIN